MDLKVLEEKLTQYKEAIERSLAQVREEMQNAQGKQRDELLAKIAELEKGLESVKAEKKNLETLGLPGAEKEIAKWSWTDFFRGQMQAVAAGKCSSVQVVSDPWHHAPHIRELCVQYAKNRGYDVDPRLGTAYVRDYSASDGASGGFLVPSEVSAEIVGATLANMPIANIPNIMRLTGLSGDLFIPTVLTRGNAYVVGENGAPTASSGTFGGAWLRPHKVGAFTKQSNRLLYQTKGVSDVIIKRNLTEAAALKMHEQLITGTGLGNEVKGLAAYVSQMTTSVNGDAISPTDGRQFVSDDALNMLTALEEIDEITDPSQAAFLMRPVVLRGIQRERVKQYSTQTRREAAPLWPPVIPTRQQINEYIGAPVYTTSQIPGNETKGGTTYCSKVYCGNWSRFVLATWRDPIFKVSDVAADGSGGSAFLEDQFYAVMFIEFDCALLRPTAFAVFDGAACKPSSWT